MTEHNDQLLLLREECSQIGNNETTSDTVNLVSQAIISPLKNLRDTFKKSESLSSLSWNSISNDKLSNCNGIFFPN